MPDVLEHEDRGIEHAAIALAFAMRPVLSAGPVNEMTAAEYWRTVPERERRIMCYRARCAVAAWEDWNG